MNKFLLFLFLLSVACQLKEPNKTHGITFLENRSNKLIVNKSNKNDVIQIIGQPHGKSINNDNIHNTFTINIIMSILFKILSFFSAILLLY